MPHEPPGAWGWEGQDPDQAMSELPLKMGVSPVVVLRKRKGRAEGLGEGESASEGESPPFSSFRPMPSPQREL